MAQLEEPPALESHCFVHHLLVEGKAEPVVALSALLVSHTAPGKVHVRKVSVVEHTRVVMQTKFAVKLGFHHFGKLFKNVDILFHVKNI
jgi:hypothetical protein